MTKSKKAAAARAAEDAINASQVLFTANPGFQPPAMHFLMAQGPIQERMREEVETFTSAWLKRRETATHELLDAAAQMSASGLTDPAAAMKVMTDWQTGAMKRLAEDVQDCTKMMTSCAESLVKKEIEAVDEMSKSTHVFEKASHATPV